MEKLSKKTELTISQFQKKMKIKSVNYVRGLKQREYVRLFY